MSAGFSSFVSTTDVRLTPQGEPDGGSGPAPAGGQQQGGKNALPPQLAKRAAAMKVTKFKAALSDEAVILSIPLVLAKGGQGGLGWLDKLGFSEVDEEGAAAAGIYRVVTHNYLKSSVDGGAASGDEYVLLSVINHSFETLLKVLLQIMKNANSSVAGSRQLDQVALERLVAVARLIYCDYCMAMAEMGPVVADDKDSSLDDACFAEGVAGIARKLYMTLDEKVSTGQSEWASHSVPPSEDSATSAVTMKMKRVLLGGAGGDEITGMEEMDFWSPCVAACHFASSSLADRIMGRPDESELASLGGQFLQEFLAFHANFAQAVLGALVMGSSMESLCKEAMHLCLRLESCVDDSGETCEAARRLYDFARISLQSGDLALPVRALLLGSASKAVFVDTTLNCDPHEGNDDATDSSVQPDAAIGRGDLGKLSSALSAQFSSSALGRVLLLGKAP